MFKKSVVHRDIKGDNIFIDLGQDQEFKDCVEEVDFITNLHLFNKDTKFTLKIGDFGVSKSLLSAVQDTQLRGNDRYKAKEVFEDDKVNDKADIWAAGVMILDLVKPHP